MFRDTLFFFIVYLFRCTVEIVERVLREATNMEEGFLFFNPLCSHPVSLKMQCALTPGTQSFWESCMSLLELGDGAPVSQRGTYSLGNERCRREDLRGSKIERMQPK